MDNLPELTPEIIQQKIRLLEQHIQHIIDEANMRIAPVQDHIQTLQAILNNLNSNGKQDTPDKPDTT